MDPQPLAPAVEAVMHWVDAVFDHAHLATAWPHTHPTLRLALAQSWVWMEADRPDVATLDRDTLAAALAAPHQPAHPLWPEFAGWRVTRWREVLPPFVSDPTQRGYVSGTHLAAPMLEAVLVAHTDGEVRTFNAGEPVEVQRFLVQHTEPDGWQVAGVGGVLPVPGWPPTETDRLPPP